MHRAPMGRSQASERMQSECLARAVAAENDNDFPGRKLECQITDQRTRSNMHAQLLRCQSTLQWCVHRISSAVTGPTTTVCKLRGISAAVLEIARRPAMISAAGCG